MWGKRWRRWCSELLTQKKSTHESFFSPPDRGVELHPNDPFGAKFRPTGAIDGAMGLRPQQYWTYGLSAHRSRPPRRLSPPGSQCTRGKARGWRWPREDPSRYEAGRRWQLDCDHTVSYTHLRAHETPEHLV